MNDRWCTQNKSFPYDEDDSGQTDVEVSCGKSQDRGLRQKYKVPTDLTGSGWLAGNVTKHKPKKEPSAVNHIPQTKLSQLYSTETTSDQCSVSA